MPSSLAGAPAEPLKEAIFAPGSAPFAASHASTVVELKNGDLMSAWFGGTAEGKPDVAIWGATRTRAKWSAPVELAREPDVPCWNPVLFHTRDGKLWLYYKFGPSPQTWTGARKWSTDEGKTWSPVEHLPAGLLGPIRAKPLVLQDGTIVSGTSIEAYRSWAAWIERSTDDGKTWAKIGPIVPPVEPDRQGTADAQAGQVPGATGILELERYRWNHSAVGSAAGEKASTTVCALDGKNGAGLRGGLLRRWRDVDTGSPAGGTEPELRHRCGGAERWASGVGLQRHDERADSPEPCGVQRR